VEANPDAEVIGGRYALGSLIGQGAMAEVYEGEDQLLTRPVAVKLMLASLAGQQDSRLRFEDEARVAARLSDPNVVAIYDTGEHAGRPFIVMELLPGRSLDDDLGGGPMSEERAVVVVGQVLGALRAAHDRGVIHRDIRPANVLLTESGDAKVADFGIAKAAASTGLTATGIVLGTPSYLAPECVVGGAATIESDLYAVGVILYQALAGRAPFVADTPLGVCHAVCNEEPPPLRDLRADVSESLIAVVSRAMAKDPGNRYHSANEMLRGLDPATEAVPVFRDQPALGPESEPTIEAPTVAPLAAGASLLPRPGAHRRSRRRALVVASVVAFAVLVAAVGFAAAHSESADTSTDTKPTTSVASTTSSALTAAPTTIQSLANTVPVTVPVTPAPVVTSPATTAPPTTGPATTAPPTTPPPTTSAPTTSPPTTSSPSTTPPTS
jgi:serine/threonine protein kinase